MKTHEQDPSDVATREQADSNRSAAEETDSGSPRRLSRRATAILTALGATVGLIVSITALVDWIGEKTSKPTKPPPQQIDARIVAATAELWSGADRAPP